MKTGRYSLKDLLTHNEIEQIIIPEIQRDYVWAEDNVVKLLSSIKKNFDEKEKNKIEILINDIELTNETVLTFLKQEYERLKHNVKIGFIYAYHDRDFAGKFFLIDGQQRITTLFLVLLYLYKRTDRSDDFRNLFYKDGILKLDYKVREQSHDFMLDFVECELCDRDYKTSVKYYANEYEKDITIQNIIHNYKVINKVLGSFELKLKEEFLSYVENFVELNYFDTHLSEQGEQLYIYMNSRGEQLSYQEIIRAELMQKVPNNKKKELGKTWEKWQNYFWINKGTKNENSDIGFEEFLKWATIIHICFSENPDIERYKIGDRTQTIKEAKENYIHRIGDRLSDQKELLFKYQTKHIDFTFLSGLFDTINYLFSLQSQFIPIQNDWLNNSIKTIDYVILLPLIVYINQNSWNDEIEKKEDIERLAMFLKNITYFEAISKNPDTSVIDNIELVKHLTNQNKDIINLSKVEGFKSILTDAEKVKFNIYLEFNQERRIFEEFVWKITSDEKFASFLMGDISIIIKCFQNEWKIVVDQEDLDFSIRLNLLRDYQKIIKDVISENRTSDKLRRLILCYFDYLIPSGSGNGKEKYSFIGTQNNWETYKEWKNLFDKEDSISMLLDIKSKQSLDLNFLFKEKEKAYNFKDWKDAFIKDYKILQYCRNKKILWEDDNRILLLSQTNYSISGTNEIQCKLLESRFEKEEMWIYENNCCVLDIQKDSNSTNISFKRSFDHYAMDIVYYPKDKKWYFTFFHRKNLDASHFQPLLQSNWIQDPKFKEAFRITKGDGVLYTFDTDKSLIENTDLIELRLRDLIKNEILPFLKLNSL